MPHPTKINHIIQYLSTQLHQANKITIFTPNPPSTSLLFWALRPFRRPRRLIISKSAFIMRLLDYGCHRSYVRGVFRHTLICFDMHYTLIIVLEYEHQQQKINKSVYRRHKNRTGLPYIQTCPQITLHRPTMLSHLHLGVQSQSKPRYRPHSSA